VSTPPSSRDSGSTNDGQPSDFLPPDWEEVSRLLDELLDTPAEDRAARIVELSRGDPARQRELERLLAEADRATPFLDESVASRFSELANANAASALRARFWPIAIASGESWAAVGWRACISRATRNTAATSRSRSSGTTCPSPSVTSASCGRSRSRPGCVTRTSVPLYDSGEVSGSLYFVMPYENGQSLRERLRQSGPLPIADALSVLRDVARALAHAHGQGVVHRDIKPDNVMLSVTLRWSPTSASRRRLPLQAPIVPSATA
jgi:serine/threonine-protein kinase